MTAKFSLESEFVQSLKKDISDFIKAGTEQKDTEKRFNDLALRLFEYQFNANVPYQRFCAKRGVEPGQIKKWEEIPAVPSNVFKEIPLATFPADQAVKLFVSSGTTSPDKRSKVYIDETGLELMDISFQESIQNYFYKSRDEKLPSLLVSPSPAAFPNNPSLMIHLSITLMKGHYEGDLEYFITREGLDVQGLIKRLKEVEQAGKPVWIGGPTFGFVHFYDYCKSQGIRFKLPEGSRIIDAAGYKGQSRSMPKEEFLALSNEITGIPYSHLINNYSMSEVHAIYADNVLYNHVRGIEKPRHKFIPPWTRVVITDPDTLEPLPKGQDGLICHYCLANLNSVMAIQTDDLGHTIEDGFEILGRAKGAEARGCSITVDEIIAAQAS